MRALILIILLSGPAYSGWRPAPISGIEQEEKNRAISYNLNNAAIQINRKIDKFGNDTVYGDLTFNKSLVFKGTNTFTGGDSFSSTISTITFSGWIDIGLETVTNATSSDANPVAVSCNSGKKVIGCSCLANVTLTRIYPSSATECTCGGSAVGDKTVYAICARIK